MKEPSLPFKDSFWRNSTSSGPNDLETPLIPHNKLTKLFFLFEVSLSDSRSLDEAEGVGQGYRKGDIQVVRPNGVATAVAYFATERDPDRRPYSWYKALVVEGAVEHGLPEAYIEALRGVASQPDPNVERRERNETLLAGKCDE